MLNVQKYEMRSDADRNASHRGHRERQPWRDQGIPQQDRLENRPPGWDTRLRAEAVP